MRFSLISLFPEVLAPYLDASIVGRARQRGLITVDLLNPRTFSTDPHRKVDDAPYGGGPGMLLACQPVEDALASLQPLALPARILMTCPSGRVLDQAMAAELATCAQVVVLCGHYEGFDARLLQLIPQVETVSLGDFVLTGGELPALCLVDAVTRLLPGAVQKMSSVVDDAFYDPARPRLDTPHYTRPAVYKGLAVPEVLRSGNHTAIARWRKQMSLRLTQQLRPDLLARAPLSQEEQVLLEAWPD
jgi:tRNA (guanine37-N1)-methyltransferase